MHFIIKIFPEITIKSKPVRKQMVQCLQNNLSGLLRAVDKNTKVVKDWDKVTVKVNVNDAGVIQRSREVLAHTPGIDYFIEVQESQFSNLDDICAATGAIYLPLIAHKSFAVRCKRSGTHEWKSEDIERYVGGFLNQRCETARVQLRHPDVTINIEVKDDLCFVVKQRFEGLGGFPLGEVEPALSLISGGFDSPVASYLCMKRGMPTHFCFFNLGGRDHELGVKEVSYYLWEKYAGSRRVKFVSVPFEPVVSEILQQVDNAYMGVVLKRMMYRAAEQIADQLKIKALVSGEVVAQVSSQTVSNLSVIDAVTNKLVLRPLITTDKEDIIRLARQIGTAEFAMNMPEYCGVISQKPTVKARIHRVEYEEQSFDFDVLDRVIKDAEYVNIDEMGELKRVRDDVEVFSTPLAESVIVDIRHHDDQELRPLRILQNKQLVIPFYSLHKHLEKLDKRTKYLLYCEKGVMSALHAAHLQEDGFNVGVYRPD